MRLFIFYKKRFIKYCSKGIEKYFIIATFWRFFEIFVMGYKNSKQITKICLLLLVACLRAGA